MLHAIHIENRSGVPKYQQLFSAVTAAIENGVLADGELIPSINEMATHFSLARGTVTKAYRSLQKRGIIAPRHGKGFYVVSNSRPGKRKVFVLFDTLNAYKEVLYNALKQELGDYASLHIFFHHHNREVFEHQILDNLSQYQHYVIMPHFNESVAHVLRMIPKEKLLVIDKDAEGLGEEYAAVYQDFERDVYEALCSGLAVLRKYQSLHLVLSRSAFQFVPDGILRGFERFGRDFQIPVTIDDDLSETRVQPGEAYILFAESDLIRLVRLVKARGWELGREIGLISYDDTPMKEILEGGITVISTDFTRMGQIAARMLRGEWDQRGRVANTSALILRNSL